MLELEDRWEVELFLILRMRNCFLTRDHSRLETQMKMETNGSLGLPFVFITPSSSSYCEIVKMKPIWFCFHRLSVVWHVCIICLFERMGRERESSWTNLSVHSSASHLFPETKTSLWAISRKKQTKPAVGCALSGCRAKHPCWSVASLGECWPHRRSQLIQSPNNAWEQGRRHRKSKSTSALGEKETVSLSYQNTMYRLPWVL